MLQISKEKNNWAKRTKLRELLLYSPGIPNSLEGGWCTDLEGVGIKF